MGMAITSGKTAAAACLFGLSGTLSFPGTQAAAADLTVGAFGGIWEQSLRKCVVEPFEKKTGKSVSIVLGSPVQWLNQIAANPGKPPVDIIYNPTENSLDAIARGLIDKLPTDKVPNMAQRAPEFTKMGDSYGTIHNYGAMGIIYNTTVVKDPPKNWKEFVEGTVAGKWKASIPNINYPSGGLTVSVWSFAETYGGGVDNIKPGLDQIKRMVKSGNLSFWSDPNQVLNGLKGGDIDMATYWDGRAWAFIDDGNKDYKFYLPDPGGVVAFTWIQKIKGSSDLGFEFANVSLSAEAQSCFGSAIRYGVVNEKAVFDPKIAHEITPASKLVVPPFKDIPSRQANWLETWNKEVGR